MQIWELYDKTVSHVNDNINISSNAEFYILQVDANYDEISLLCLYEEILDYYSYRIKGSVKVQILLHTL